MRTWMVLLMAAWSVDGQEYAVFEPPDPSHFYQNTIFATKGDFGLVPATDNDVLWSFDLSTGGLADPDGLVLPGPCSGIYVFNDTLAALPGNFESGSSYWGIFSVDISDPAQLEEIGLLPLEPASCVSGQDIEADSDGTTGYLASFTDDKLHSFDALSLEFLDPDGLSLPGNPDRMALAGDLLTIVDTSTPSILVVDVSDPSNLSIYGTIDLPGSPSFSSNNNIVFAADGRTGFVSTNERTLYSFDVIDLQLLDPDGISYGSDLYGGNVGISGSTVGCVYSRGLSFIDVSDPTGMILISDADFGETVAPQGSATVGFSADGTKAAVPVVYPDHYVYTFVVATGEQYMERFSVDPQPNFLAVIDTDNQVGVLCAQSGDPSIWLIDGLLGQGSGSIGTDDPFPAPGPVLSVSPNPSPGPTTIQLSGYTGSMEPVSIELVDVSGRVIRELPESTGNSAIYWDGCASDGTKVPTGVYLIRAATSSFACAEKLLVIRQR